jgi:hypothetical protein
MDGAYLLGSDGSYLVATPGPTMPVVVNAQYRLLRPHWFGGAVMAPDTVVVGGLDVPMGWVPTLAVDPLTADAVTAFYNAGPRDWGVYEDTNFWAGVGGVAPVTYWKTVGLYWTLTGLGAGLPGILVG